MSNHSVVRGTGRRIAAVASLVFLSVIIGCGGGGKPQNAVLIVIGGCRYDEVGRATHEGPVTPEMDRFAREGTRFLQANSQAPWTLPSMATLLTSLYPAVHGAGGQFPEFQALRPDVRSGPAILAENGIQCAAFVNGPFLAPPFGLDDGFAPYDHAQATGSRIRSAAVTLGKALDWLGDRESERFFLFVHLIDPMMDFDPPQEFASRFLKPYEGSREAPFRGLARWEEEVPEHTVRSFAKYLYRAEVSAVDHEIGRFLDGLDTLGVARNTAVFITSDHGQEIWEHGGFGDGHTMYDELLHIPLLVRVPDRNWPNIVTGRVGSIDLMPTIFELLQIPVPEPFQGESLVSFAEGREARRTSVRYAESILRGGEWKAALGDRFKLIAKVEGAQKALLDLLVDPSEKASMTRTYSKQVEEYEELLAGWLEENLERAAELGEEGRTVLVEREDEFRD